MNKLIASIFLAGILAACTGGQRSQPEQSADTLAMQQEQEQAVTVDQVWATDSVFDTPESVLYDRDNNVLYVSNVGGEDPSAKDGNGFISKLSTSGEVVELQWVTGLDAPKGLGVANGSLYATDIDRLVEINLESGEITNTYPVEGAGFLNDVATSDDGTVYFSDSETGMIHSLQDGQVSVVVEEGVDGVNGLYVENGNLLALANGDSQLKSIGLDGSAEMDSIVNYTGHGDGIVPAGSDDYLISNWQGEVFYLSSDEQLTKIIDTKDQEVNAADIDYISDDNLLLVPTFFDNRVVAYQVNKSTTM